MKERLNNLVDTILVSPKAELTANKALIDELIDLLTQITNIELYPNHFLDEHGTVTSQGKAVSMITAAQCADEYMRTQVFLRGVYQAIKDQLQTQDVIHLLYAGTGPFGLLVLPLLHRFSPDQIRVTVLDIHLESLQALNQVAEALQVADFIEHQACTDILQWSLPQEPYYDLIVSETMKAMLAQEPQVSIFRHLQPALKTTGEFIPQSIDIELWLSCRPSLNQQDHFISKIFSLDRTTVAELAVGASAESGISGVIPIADYPDVYSDTVFKTVIQVYQHECLAEKQCSLTLPQMLIDSVPAKNSEIHFSYQICDQPGFHFQIEKASGWFNVAFRK